jgi:hypothetical protein
MGMRNVNEPEVPNVPPCELPAGPAGVTRHHRLTNAKGLDRYCRAPIPAPISGADLSSVAEVGRTNGLFATTNKNPAGGGPTGFGLADFFGVWGARCQVIISSRRAVYWFLKKAQRAVRCSSFSAKPWKSAAISVSAVFTYNSSASLARFIQSSACRRYSFDVGIAALRLCPTSPKVIWFPRGPRRTLQVSDGPRREAGDRGGLWEVTDSRVGRSLDEAFFSRNVGRFVALHCSASSASLVQVRAMSSRMSCTRMLGARSAI